VEPLNKLIVCFSGTNDARGMRQWNKVNRYVNGSQGYYIIGPMIKKVDRITADDNQEHTVISGFRAIPVFKVEDTNGDPLEHTSFEFPELPLINRARGWDIGEDYFLDKRCLGY
jgi:hypothetical protein